VPPEIAADLRALGAKPESLRTRADIVFDALLLFWREKHRGPTSRELGAVIHRDKSNAALQLRALYRAGRVRRYGNGNMAIYIPKVANA
jgi:hypothetical protein